MIPLGAVGSHDTTSLLPKLTRVPDEPSHFKSDQVRSKPMTEEEGTWFPVIPFSLSTPSLTAPSYPAAAAELQADSGPAVRSPPTRRAPRGTRKISAQATRLEAVDNTVDPLGPLGEPPSETTPTTDEAPAPPQKEPFAARGARPLSSPSQASSGGMGDSVNPDEDVGGFRGPPPVQLPVDAEGTKRQSQPSVSVEQAAKPTFDINVGDPHKVGDLTSSHIVYQVRTKVLCISSVGGWSMADSFGVYLDHIQGIPRA